MSIKSFGERIADVLIEDGLLLPSQLAEAVDLQKKQGGKVTRWGFDIGDLSSWWGLQSLSWAAGTAFFDSPTEPKKFTFEDPGNIGAMKFVQDLMWTTKVAPTPDQRTASQ